MKNFILFITAIISLSILAGCSHQSYVNNGESIYRTGKNLEGRPLLDKSNSQIRIIKSCQGCHGKNGDRMRNCNIKWSYLSDPGKITVAYNDSLFTRFLDKDIKSDGAGAQTGVHWNMTTQEKKDLLEFLKSL
jgi:hypothetical protein